MKPIILMVNGDTLELKTKSRLVKGNVSQYVLYFSGIDKRLSNVAEIESITKKHYSPIDNKGMCRIPCIFNNSDEIKITLVSADLWNDKTSDAPRRTESVYLRFKG